MGHLWAVFVAAVCVLGLFLATELSVEVLLASVNVGLSGTC